MLPILGDLSHSTTCRCTRCTDGSPALWLIEAALLELHPSKRARKLMATVNGYTIDDDPFIKVELMLAATLATSFGAAAEQAEHILKDAFEAKPLDRRKIDEALAQANKLLGNVIDAATLLRIEKYVDELISNGARDAVKADRLPDPQPDPVPEDGPDKEAHTNLLYAGLLAGGIAANFPVGRDTILEGVPSVTQVFSGIVASAKYYTNNHFNQIIMPEIQRRVEELMTSETTLQPDPTDIIEYIGRRLSSVPYWRVVANAAASRAYHYGALKAGELLGVRAYRLQAVLDERTSEICQLLDGKEFWLSDAVRLLEKAAAVSVDEVKDLMPWPSYDEIEDLSVDDLRDMGCMVPPFHGNCRTTVIFIYNN